MIFYSGCTQTESGQKRQEKIKIAVNPWVGYTPLFYLDRNGTLEKLGFKLVYVSSLGENANLLSNHLVDGFAATQYEYLNYKNELSDIVPIFTVDKSAGADKIHSNVTLETLQKTDKPIDVYLEFGSVNEDLLQNFLKAYQLTDKKLRYHHNPQSVIKTLQNRSDRLVLAISYEPFSTLLEKNGIREIASSKNLDILILDALFTSKALLQRSKTNFIALQRSFWQAQKILEKEPKTFYRLIKIYLEGQAYDNFLKSLDGMKWLPSSSPEIRQKLKNMGIETDFLL